MITLFCLGEIAIAEEAIPSAGPLVTIAETLGACRAATAGGSYKKSCYDCKDTQLKHGPANAWFLYCKCNRKGGADGAVIMISPLECPACEFRNDNGKLRCDVY